MAYSTLTELLAPQVIMRVISRLRRGHGPLASWLGFQPRSFDEETVTLGGPNTFNSGNSVRNFAYRIFDRTRIVARGKAPGTGPATITRNPVGSVQVEVPRFHQKIPLLWEEMGNLSMIAGPNSQIDPGGRSYIDQQIGFMGEQFGNIVEMMAAGMLRDSLYFIFSGNSNEVIYPSFTAPTGTQVGFQINYQIPAGNKNQLNALGTGNIIGVSWANNAAPILDDIMQIKAAYAQLCRYPLTDIWINSTMWMNIVQNTQVRNAAGTANSPFVSYQEEKDFGAEKGAPVYYATLVGDPTVRWHMCDDTVALGGEIDPSYLQGTATLNKLIPDNMAIFTTTPNLDWTQFYQGGEYVSDNPGMPAVLRNGYYFWREFVTQPSAVELIGLLNGLPVLFIPKAVMPATVVF